MTDNDIKKALECCKNNRLSKCHKCPAGKIYENCSQELLIDALDLINRQQEDKQNLEIELQAMRGANKVIDRIKSAPTADVVEVVRCKDCIHAVELDKHCEFNRTAYKHCTLLRGDETKYVWHKYKKYYKDYSIVEPDDYCSCGIKRGDTE